MITWQRTADIHDGRLQETFAWAAKVTKYVNHKFPGVNLYAARNVDGPLFQIHWFATYDSLAAYEKLRKQLESDEGYGRLLAEIREQGHLIGASVVDALYEKTA